MGLESSCKDWKPSFLGGTKIVEQCLESSCKDWKHEYKVCVKRTMNA